MSEGLEANVCPKGEEAYVDEVSNAYYYCSKSNYVCPTGYICKAMINNPEKYHNLYSTVPYQNFHRFLKKI